MNRYVHCQSGSIIAVTYDNNNIVYTQPQKRSRARATTGPECCLRRTIRAGRQSRLPPRNTKNVKARAGRDGPLRTTGSTRYCIYRRSFCFVFFFCRSHTSPDRLYVRPFFSVSCPMYSTLFAVFGMYI